MPEELARWRGEVDTTLKTHSESHKLHFAATDKLKTSLTELRARIAVYALIGAGLGGFLASLLVAIIAKKF